MNRWTDYPHYYSFSVLSMILKRSSSAFSSGYCFGLTGKTTKPELNALSRTAQTGPSSRRPTLNSPMDLPSILTPINCIGAMLALIWLVGWTLMGHHRRFSIAHCLIRLDWMFIMISCTGLTGRRLVSFEAPSMVEGKLSRCLRSSLNTCMACAYLVKNTNQVVCHRHNFLKVS